MGGPVFIQFFLRSWSWTQLFGNPSIAICTYSIALFLFFSLISSWGRERKQCCERVRPARDTLPRYHCQLGLDSYILPFPLGLESKCSFGHQYCAAKYWALSSSARGPERPEFSESSNESGTGLSSSSFPFFGSYKHDTLPRWKRKAISRPVENHAPSWKWDRYERFLFNLLWYFFPGGKESNFHDR